MEIWYYNYGFTPYNRRPNTRPLKSNSDRRWGLTIKSLRPPHTRIDGRVSWVIPVRELEPQNNAWGEKEVTEPASETIPPTGALHASIKKNDTNVENTEAQMYIGENAIKLHISTDEADGVLASTEQTELRAL